MLSKTRHFFPVDKLLSIYFAIFSSHMAYGCLILGLNKSSLNFKKIERLWESCHFLVVMFLWNLFSKYSISLRWRIKLPYLIAYSFITELTIFYHLTLMTLLVLCRSVWYWHKEKSQVAFLHLNIPQTPMIVNQFKCQLF